MQTIRKYILDMDNRRTVLMPSDAQILSVGVHRGDLALWALVNTDNPLEQREFRVYGTGEPFDNEETIVFVGMVHFEVFHLVYHVFEIIQTEEKHPLPE